MSKQDFIVNVEEILNTIDRLTTQYKTYTGIDKIKVMISDSVAFICNQNNIRDRNRIFADLKETIKSQDELKDTKINVYKKDAELDVLALLMLKLKGFDEEDKEISRARYNLATNNEIFRLLNYILNKSDRHNQFIIDNFKVLKLNSAFFLINYYFERLRSELIEIMKKDESEINVEMDKLCSMYNDNQSVIQLMYEVLIQNFNSIQKELKSKSPLIGRYLKDIGVTGDRNSIKASSNFIYLRNAASHGEIYPNLADEKVVVENTPNGKEKQIREFSFDNIINFAMTISTLFDKKDVSLFHQILFSNDIINLANEINLSMTDEDLLKQFGVLLLFNTIQYNNEHHFQLINNNDDIQQYISKINIKDYFDASFDKKNRSIYDFMEIIKNAIGHMNIDLSEDELTFTNALKNEVVTTSLVKLYEFVLQNDIYILTSSTIYFNQLQSQKDKIINAFVMNNNIGDVSKVLFGDEYDELEVINKYKDMQYDNSYYDNINLRK